MAFRSLFRTLVKCWLNSYDGAFLLKYLMIDIIICQNGVISILTLRHTICFIAFSHSPKPSGVLKCELHEKRLNFLSTFDLYWQAFGLSREIYFVNLCIRRAEYGKMKTRKNLRTGTLFQWCVSQGYSKILTSEKHLFWIFLLWLTYGDLIK